MEVRGRVRTLFKFEHCELITHERGRVRTLFFVMISYVKVDRLKKDLWWVGKKVDLFARLSSTCGIGVVAVRDSFPTSENSVSEHEDKYNYSTNAALGDWIGQKDHIQERKDRYRRRMAAALGSIFGEAPDDVLSGGGKLGTSFD